MRLLGPVFFFIFALLLFLSPESVFAQTCPSNETTTEIGCIPNDPIGFVEKFYTIGLGLIGGVAVLFIIYSGYILLTSQGNPTEVGKAKSYLYYAIAGLLLAVFGYVFFEFVVIDILHLPGFNR